MRNRKSATGRFSIGILGLALALGWTLRSTVGEAEDAEKELPAFTVGRKVPNFILSDLKGEQVALTDHAEKRFLVLFFAGTGCPIANLYVKELGRLQEAYAEKGLQVIGIHSNAGTTKKELVEHAEEFKIPFPLLQDPDQRVAELLGATRTAEVFLLDSSRVVRYHGRIDDRFGYTYKREEPRRRDLKVALDQLLAGEKVAVAETKPLGCLITHSKRDPSRAKVTYAKEVSRILRARCDECHRPGMIGPFSLLSYQDARKHSAMIKEVVLERRMPPWHADPRYGHFKNNRRMPQEEVDTLMEWIDSGMPFGDEKDLPPPKEYVEGWVIGKPDVIFELPEEITVQADGVVPYLYFTVPTNFEEDVWVQAAEARPGNRAVVHHIIVSSISEEEGKKSTDGQTRRNLRGRMVVGTAPGDPPAILPKGVATKIPAGSYLEFQMHYTPTGKVEKDRSMVGLIFYRGSEPPRATARTRGVMNVRFAIPPRHSNYRVDSSYTFKRDAQILSLMPHMHLRGKDFLYRATYPDGRSEILLSVPSYDFNWQNSYKFSEAVRAPQGTRIDCVAHFDNSEGNPANPDPSKTVYWGDQTWEEMMIGWITYIHEGPEATSH